MMDYSGTFTFTFNDVNIEMKGNVNSRKNMMKSCRCMGAWPLA